MSKPVVAVIGMRKSCGYCKKLYALTKDGALSKLLPGMNVIDADPSASQSEFEKYRKLAKASGSIPIVAVFGADGKLAGKFVGRPAGKKDGVVKPFTAARIAEMVNALCADCSVPDIPDVPADPPVVPPVEDTGCIICSCGAKIAFCQACGKKVCG